MTPAHGEPLQDAVELLERSLAYTGVALADVRSGNLRNPTPCDGWTLGRLLEHMADALDAFTEAASGRVEVLPGPPTSTRVDALREKACALLGAWVRARQTWVRVGDQDLGAALLVATAALEITVHGWDVAQATGRRSPLPQELARRLLPVAQAVIDPADRGTRFGPPLEAPPATSHGRRLLAYLGRHDAVDLTGPPGTTSDDRHSRRGLAS